MRRAGGGCAGLLGLAICAGAVRACGAHGSAGVEPTAVESGASAPLAGAVDARAETVHAARVSAFAAMTPAQRATEAPKLCPPVTILPRQTVRQILDDYVPCEDEDGALALLESVRGTPEEASIRAAIEKARKRSWAAAGKSLKCCDGTISDSCSCGGSHRGCCSHHGGVCGCE